MPRVFNILTEENRTGTLVVEARSNDFVEVFYIPPEGSLPDSETADSSSRLRAKVIEIDARQQRLTLFPIRTFEGDDDFLRQKYHQVERISLTDPKMLSLVGDGVLPSTQYEVMMLLEDLPPCFVKDFDYGLGFQSSYRSIVDAIEVLSDCNEIEISNARETGPNEDGNTFCISTKDLDFLYKSMRRTMSNSQAAARSVKYGVSYNYIANILGEPEISVSLGKSPIRMRVTNLLLGQEEPLSEEEQETVFNFVLDNSRTFAAAKSNELNRLQRGIDIANLENLIVQYEAMIEKSLPEAKWQAFLNNHPFILNMAFGYPIIVVGSQASVGGRRINGTGDRIVDYLVQNRMTNNTAIVEIKKPTTRLLNKRLYRNEVYQPSSDLTGAISQVLDQKYELTRRIVHLKDDSGRFDLETYSVRCYLIIGMIPCDKERIKAFEMFRGNLKDVEIVTFDELLEKLKSLRVFLKTSDS